MRGEDGGENEEAAMTDTRAETLRRGHDGEGEREGEMALSSSLLFERLSTKA